MIIELEQGSPEWHGFRKTHIGASEAPIIMGVSPWSTPHKLWQEKLGLLGEKEPTQWMQRGIEQEEIARQAYIAHTGTPVLPAVLVSEELDWMSASLDGISNDGKTIVEIKNPGQKDHDIAKSGSVPDKYFPQCQHQLAVSKADVLHYFSFRDGDFALVEFYPDQEYIEKMIEQEKKFWDCLQNFIEPKKCARDEDKDFIERDDEEWERAVMQAVADKAELQAAQEKAKASNQKLIDLAAGRNCRGYGITVQKVVRKGSVDYKKVPELQGVDLEKYRNPPSESWRVS